jgi:hypothetical protein
MSSKETVKGCASVCSSHVCLYCIILLVPFQCQIPISVTNNFYYILPFICFLWIPYQLQIIYQFSDWPIRALPFAMSCFVWGTPGLLVTGSCCWVVFDERRISLLIMFIIFCVISTPFLIWNWPREPSFNQTEPVKFSIWPCWTLFITWGPYAAFHGITR